MVVIGPFIIPGYFNAWYYGLRYNDDREKAGIPTIPLDWTCKKTSSNYILCHHKDRKFVLHRGKEIEYKWFSICSERDSYLHQDTVKGEQILSFTRYYNDTKVDVSYASFVNTKRANDVQISFDEGEKIMAEWEKLSESFPKPLTEDTEN